MYANNTAEVIDLRPQQTDLPPSNTEAEESILGGILIDPNAIERIADTLLPEAFYISSHAIIYNTALDLFAQGKPVDPLSVTIKLRDDGYLDKIGGRNKLATLVDRTVSAVNIDHLAKMVMEKYQRRRMIKTGQKIVELGYETGTEYTDCLETAEKHLSSLQELGSRATGPTLLKNVLIGSYERIERLAAGHSDAIATGLYDLDAALSGGLRAGELVTVMGRPSMGKSAFSSVLIRNVTHPGTASVLFNLEMDSIQTSDRLLAAETEIDFSRLRTGRLSEGEWGKFMNATELLSELPMYLDDDPSITIASLRARAKAIKKQCEADGKKLGAVVVDYVQLLARGGNSPGEKASAVDNATRDLKLLARELEVAVVMLSQINRGVEGRTNKRPTLADAADSSGIEKHSDIMIGLYRDEYYNADTPDRGILELIILKQRNGPCCTIKTLFEGQYQQIKNLARNSY